MNKNNHKKQFSSNIDKRKPNSESGGIIIMNTLFFLVISVIIVFGIASPVLSTYAASNAMIKSKQAFIVANSAGEEALYRLKTNKNLSSSEVLSLVGGTATINVGDSLGAKTVSIRAQSKNHHRNLQMSVEKGVGVSFNYGLQSGRGGFQMSGGAGINGNVYSNGNIIGSGGPFITGSATVANQSDPEANQSNLGPENPPYQIDFGGNGIPQDFAQSFQVTTSVPVTSIKFYIKKSTNNWMNNITVRLTPDNNGKPSRHDFATGAISAQQVTTAFNYMTIPFTSNPILEPGETYWVILDTGTTWGSYYSLGAMDNSYEKGTAKVGQWNNQGGNWDDTAPAGLDAYFEVFVGGETGIIQGVRIGESGGDAWAHEVNNSNVYGDIYCQAGTGNNKACDTSRIDPVQMPLPVSDGNIEEWKNIAEAGGTIQGDLVYAGSDFDSFGPIKIDGDLTLTEGAIVELTGTTWVTGNISIGGGSILRLALNYTNEGGIIVTDGQISLTGGGVMEGAGDAGSYILAVTTSECPNSNNCDGKPAIRVTGGTGSVVLNAQKGTIGFSGGASAKQATAETVVMGGGTIVDYEEGLADMNFSSGPSGSWNLISWREVE